MESASGWGRGSNPVQLGIRSTSSPFVYLVWEDEKLFEKAHKVIMVFDDGRTVSTEVEDKRGFLLFYNTEKEAANLKVAGFELHIYDGDENIIYEN